MTLWYCVNIILTIPVLHFSFCIGCIVLYQKINEHTSPTRTRTYQRMRARNGEASG